MTRPGRNQEVFPHVEERIGEDPARFLDRDFLDYGGIEFVKARIQGIDRLEVIAAWQGVEKKLIRTPDGGRRKINQLLQRRARQIERNGDRDEQLKHRLHRAAEVDQEDLEDDEPTVWRHEPCGSIDVERESKMAWFCKKCQQRTNRVEEVEAPEVAA